MNTIASRPLDPIAGLNQIGGLRRADAASPPRQSSRAEARTMRNLEKILTTIDHGELTLVRPDGESRIFGAARAGEPRAVLHLHDGAVFSDVLARGDIGFGETFIDGRWSSPNLTALLTLLNRNRDTIRQAIYGNWWSLLVERLRHVRNANSRTGSRRNIMAHYDLGNAFYGEWLDPTMSYSSALFTDDTDSLADAQRAKYRRIVERLGIRPGDRVLEIGCGWGGFAELAASEAGAKVFGVTLSPAQLAFAQERMNRAGLADQVQLELRDYRDVEGPFDHVVSIEMFEAVGETWWPTYFRTLERCLKPGGGALVQTITIDDRLFASYRRGTDFIQQHVFPGGMLPSRSAFETHARQAGLQMDESFGFGFDYARTLALWQQAFNAGWERLASGFDARFHRLWNFYLSYCQAGFAAGSTDVVQFHMRKAGASPR